MVELLAAYDALLDSDLSDRARGSQLAYSCEAYTVEELAADGKHDVHALRIVLETSLLEASGAMAGASGASSFAGDAQVEQPDAMRPSSSGHAEAVLVQAHLDDS